MPKSVVVGLYTLDGLCKKYRKGNIGLYRDDGLAIFRNTSGPQADKIRQGIARQFKNDGLKISKLSKPT